MADTSGIKNLAYSLQKRMSSVSQYGNTDNLAIGTITGNKGIKLDGMDDVIPASDYLICRSLKMKKLTVNTKAAGDPSHSHSLEIETEKANELKPGDRVLVGYAGSAIVVMDVLVMK